MKQPLSEPHPASKGAERFGLGVRVNLTSRRSSVCSPGNIGVHSYRLSLESRHRRQEARCFNIEHAELLLREALQSSIVFVVSIYGINSILDARTGHAFAKIERGATRQAVISQLGKPDVSRPRGKNLPPMVGLFRSILLEELETGLRDGNLEDMTPEQAQQAIYGIRIFQGTLQENFPESKH
jgi:hypothetical protein